ncbi:MAG: tRNA (adenosine(37)-N6)-threonylcarbamoyltransferase complex transferase subunit TsaD [Clostridia bacterium]|nr:tRNA (adenosine(37)-N6)-threonylcarbamoyltransferase complex transferase subunit TsaD [Clostridia bacterium]
MYILGIESSCDETAAAVLQVNEAGEFIPLSNIVNSQIAIHRLYGGVVPEIASRAHIKSVSEVTRLALEEAHVTPHDLSLVAVTSNPGLIGALLVGVNFAKSLAFAHHIPLVAVNHMKAHIAAAFVHSVAAPAPTPPFLGLAVSGGHTSLYYVHDFTHYEEIGATRDDAIGESFDKVGRLLGLPYPAGAAFDGLTAKGFATLCPSEPSVRGYKKAKLNRQNGMKLPSPALCDGTLDFSFSGLKTASVNLIHHYEQKGEEVPKEELACAFTYEAVEGVYTQVNAAMDQYGNLPLVVAGGVAANSHLRQRLSELATKRNISLSLPPLSLCGDNGLMVAMQGYFEWQAGHLEDTHLNASAMDLL